MPSVLAGRHRAPALAILVGIGLLLMLAPVHAWLLSLFDAAEVLIRQRATWGMVAFVVLAALSAMVAFLSSVVLMPVALNIWGPAVCFALLWTGWFLGGLAGYGIGRFLGRPAVEILVRPGTLARYEGWAASGKSLFPMLMLQLAIPSDLASYLFGLVRCRFIVFAAALALAEVPYALGAVPGHQLSGAEDRSAAGARDWGRAAQPVGNSPAPSSHRAPTLNRPPGR